VQPAVQANEAVVWQFDARQNGLDAVFHEAIPEVK